MENHNEIDESQHNSNSSMESAWLTAIISSADDAIISKTLEGIITSWNKGAEHIFGYTSDEVIGKPVLILIPSHLQDEEPQILERIRRGERIEHYETIRQHKNGSLIDISLTVSPIKSPNGKIIGVSKIARDISYQKSVEKRLRDEDRRKDEFLATLAHELRNPLAPIRSGLEIIRRFGDNKEKLNETLAIIERQTNQIIHLVDDLLDISRISQGKIKLRRSRVELRTALELALETTQESIEEAEIKLDVILPTEPIYIYADLTRVSQIFLNIINNAAKYNHHGGKITITVKTIDAQAIISVKDTGLGIAPEMIGKIFDMFSQVENNAERVKSGLGIGLSVVKKLVEMHEGTIQANSEGLGYGSEFIVRLPLSLEQNANLPNDNISEKELRQTAQIETLNNSEINDFQTVVNVKRILVVDDNQDAVEMMETLLKLEGHDVRTAFDGKKALEIAKEFQPEICLCDIGLPEMNGFELARQLAQLLPKSLLISISGWGQQEDRRLSHEAGFKYHLVKPIEIEELLKLIK